MSHTDLQRALLSTITDGAISRNERKALRSLLEDEHPSPSALAALRHDLFLEVGARMHDPRDRPLLTWLSDALALLEPREEARDLPRPRVLFGPRDPMVETVVGLIDGARASLDVAVFTITDDRVRDALIRAHRRGVHIRVLTDRAKSHDPGSDVQALRRAGVETALDDSVDHFHHKFAIFDGEAVVTGSYNWTRGADRDNRENFLVTWDPEVVGPYQQGFDRMWREIRH